MAVLSCTMEQHRRLAWLSFYVASTGGGDGTGGSEGIFDDAEQAALREPARAAADWRAGKAAAVAARKAAAPPEVRTVLDDAGFMRLHKSGRKDETTRVARTVAAWLVGAHAAAPDDPATKRLARLVLGIRFFAENMAAFLCWNHLYKPGLRRVLSALGAPLG